jgi:hypothetical protein
MATLLLNSFFQMGEKIGPILAWTFSLLMVVEIIYVMVKYLGGPAKK